MKKIFTMSILLLSLFSLHMNASARELSKNDQLFREDIQYRLSAQTQAQIYRIMNGYRAKIAKMDTASANALTDTILGKLDTILYKMSAAESNNHQLGKSPSSKYMAYMLIKFELELLR